MSMKVYDGLEQFERPADGVVLTIGNFDGVHLGHRLLIEAAHRHARASSLPTVAMTFEPHPLAVIAPDRAPAILTTLDEKLELLEALHVDAAIVLRSTRALFGRTAEEFVSDLVTGCGPRAIVEGPTFTFGRGRSGDVDKLREFGCEAGFTVTVVEERHSGEIATNPAINSSAIRAALRDGRLDDANAMLGRFHRITGVVGHGQQRGVDLGFPTANVHDVPQLLPDEAVYAAVAQLTDDSLHLAAVNVGPQPTFAQEHARVEAHLLGFDGDIYGRRLALHFVSRLRGQVRFSGAEALVAQLREDIEQTRACTDAIERVRAQTFLPL